MTDREEYLELRSFSLKDALWQTWFTLSDQVFHEWVDNNNNQLAQVKMAGKGQMKVIVFDPINEDSTQEITVDFGPGKKIKIGDTDDSTIKSRVLALTILYPPESTSLDLNNEISLFYSDTNEKKYYKTDSYPDHKLRILRAN